MRNMKKQRGYLLIVAMGLIVTIGLFAAVIVHNFLGSSSASISQLAAGQALYIAEGGLEYGKHVLFSSNINDRVACAAINSDINLQNVAFGEGVFTLENATSNYVATPATLSSSVSASAAVIPISTITGYTSSGRVLIDTEEIDYSDLSSISATCGGNAPCLIGAVRGVNDSLDSSHAAGAKIAQYQCQLTAIGGVPDLVNPEGKYSITTAISLQEAWAVGEKSGSNMTFTRWGYPIANQWNDDSFNVGSAKADLNDIALVNYTEGWAVGDKRSGNFTIRAWDPVSDSWIVSSGIPSSGEQDLYGVSAVASNEAWAAGKKTGDDDDDDGTNYTVLHWDGSAWCVLSVGGNGCSSISIPAPPSGDDDGDDDDGGSARDLNGVSVLDTTGNSLANIGFAVGNNGHILTYNGSNWSLDTSPTTTHLSAVSTISTNEAWAVGNNGLLLKWNGSSWSTQTSPTSTHLNSIYMLDTNGNSLADIGWAVGNSGAAIYYNGSSWSAQNAGGGHLNDVTIFSEKDAWAVGHNGRTTHWNGSGWTDFNSGVSKHLNAIAKVAP